MYMISSFFFFSSRRRHTRFDCDWSSDVCSSDLAAEADDLVQETMLKAYRAWEQYQKGTNAKGWLLTILRHAFINEYRRRTRHPETVDLDAIEPFSVFEELQDEDPQGTFFDRIVDDV